MRFSLDWNRMVDGNGEPCGRPAASQDVVFDAVDTLESTLSGLGYRLVYTRREIVAEEGSEPRSDTFQFNGDDLTELLGLPPGSVTGFKADMIVRAALAAVRRDQSPY